MNTRLPFSAIFARCLAVGAALFCFTGITADAAEYVPQKFPYVAVEHIVPTVLTTENCRIGWYVTDFDHSLWRNGDGSKRFDVFVKWTKDDTNWSSLSVENIPSQDGSFNLGQLPAGEYSVGVWCRDRSNGLESHKVWHEFRVVEPGSLDIPEAKIRRMTAADLTAYGLRNDGDYERVHLIPSDDPALVNGGQFNMNIAELTEKYLKVVDDYLAEHPHQDNAGTPGYTVYTASFKDAPIDRAYCRKRICYDTGYDRAAVAAIAEANSVGLQRFLDDAAASGCRKVVLMPGTYRVSYKYTLQVPDRMILDLGGATLKLDGFTGVGTMMVALDGVTDAGLCNGTVEGDYFEHVHPVGDDNEAVHGWSIHGASSYVTVSNVVAKYITGYGGGNGSGSSGAGTSASFSLSGRYSGFIYDEATGLWRSPYKDITAFSPYHYLTVSKSTGYRGVLTREWVFLCDFHDADLNLISRETCFQYRKVRIPPNAKFARFYIQAADEDEALYNDLTVHLPKIPHGCTIVHNIYDRCRCVGHASSAMHNFLFFENEFRFSGEAQATCAYDAEDGWDDMQDTTFLRNNFHDNNRSELLTCCGHNFRMIGNTAKISLNARTFSPYIASNICKSAAFSCTWRTRTGCARYIDNVITGTLTLGGERNASTGWDVVMHDMTFDASDPNCPKKIVGGATGRFRDCTFIGIDEAQIPSADRCTFRNCKTGLMRWHYSGEWNDCLAENYTFTKQWCTNQFVNSVFLDSNFKSAMKSPQTFINCAFTNTVFNNSLDPAPVFLDEPPVIPPVEPEPEPVPVVIGVGGNGEVADISSALAQATNALNIIEVAAGTYMVTTPIVITNAVTIRPKSGAEVIIDADWKCRVFELNHRLAKLEGLVIRRGGTAKNGGYNGLGVYIYEGTLERCLVTDCKRTAYADRQMSEGAVYLEKGLVDGCTISSNVVTRSALYIADRPNCIVRDTIVRDNVSLRDASPLRPDVNAPGINSVRENLVTSHSSGGIVAYTGEVSVSTSVELNDVLEHASDGLVIKVVEGEYELYKTYAIMDSVRLIGIGDRSRTILRRVTPPDGPVLYIDNEYAFVANVTLCGGKSSREGGGVWIDNRGGTISNCIVTANQSGVNAGGGGVYMTSANALVTDSLISGNVAGGASPGGGVLLSTGTLADSTVISNRIFYADRTASNGGGVAMDTVTTDAHVVNCTISENHDNSGAGLYRRAKAGTVENTMIFDNVKHGATDPDPFEGEGYINVITNAAYTSLSAAFEAIAGGASCAVLAGGTYTIASELTLDRPATLMAAPGAEVIIDAEYKCRCITINNANAVVDGIRFLHGQVSGNGAGVQFGPNGGTLRNCSVESCKVSGSGKKGVGIYMNSANAVVSNCVIMNCDTTNFNGDHGGALGVHIDNGTLEDSLITGCNWSGNYREGKKFESAVTLAAGTVRGCVISNNIVSSYALKVDNSANCRVTDTISTCNTSLRGVGANIPNANEIGASAVIENLQLGTVAKLPAGEYSVNNVADLEDLLAQEKEDGVVIRIAEGTYTLSAGATYALRGAVKIIGAGRDKTILNGNGKRRLFYINHADALVANLTMYNGNVNAKGGGLWIDGRGGTVSNCAVRGCSTGASQAGGGVWMNSSAAHITQSIISKNTVGQNTSCGGVLLSYGTLDNCLVISNTAQYSSRSAVIGVGVHMDTSTADAKLVNCTIANNTGYNAALYRAANAGYVVNTISYGNNASDTSKDANFYSSDSGTARPMANCILKCCSSVALGTGGIAVDAAPFLLPMYELDVGGVGLQCKDQGDNSYVDSPFDCYGNQRISNDVVDIGAVEYAKTEIVPGMQASVLQAVGETNVTLTATVDGADISDCTDCEWYIDDAAVPDGTGISYTHRFGYGRHKVKVVLTIGGEEYEKESTEDFISIYARDVYVDLSSADPVWPYTAAHPATNLNEAVVNAAIDGVTVHIAAGSYPVTNTVSLKEGIGVIGAGMNSTVVYVATAESISAFAVNYADAYVEGLTISNALGNAGVRITHGHVTKCRITNCNGSTNQDGGGAVVSGSDSRLDCSVIQNCDRWQWNAIGNGGGVSIESGGRIENCLITGNRACVGAGIHVNGGGIVRNCTITGNYAKKPTNGSDCRAGGMVIAGTTSSIIDNCIIWGNTADDIEDSQLSAQLSGNTSYLRNCCVPVSAGTDCVTDDPGFRNSAKSDFRISARSPCARLADSSDWAGLYDDWMADAKDFFGNPRATGSHKVAIGYYQPCTVETVLMLK